MNAHVHNGFSLDRAVQFDIGAPFDPAVFVRQTEAFGGRWSLWFDGGRWVILHTEPDVHPAWEAEAHLWHWYRARPENTDTLKKWLIDQGRIEG
jgi:hypothetical protein